MRNILVLFFLAVLAVTVFPGAAAAEPTVTLSVAEDAANGGLPVSVVLTSDQPMPEDTELLFADSHGNACMASMNGGVCFSIAGMHVEEAAHMVPDTRDNTYYFDLNGYMLMIYDIYSATSYVWFRL